MNKLFQKKTDELLVPARFQQVIILHILKNLLKKTEVRVPLILGIHGPSGEGKTVQLETTLRKMGVKRFLISGGQLDSPLSGEPAALIRSTYISASDAKKRGECSLAAVLINDIDTGLGSWGGANLFTMNQQTVFGELMHLVDYPNMVESHETVRIPIIITGNDFTKLYQPLVRAGRMTSFEWVPTLEERAQVVARMYPELTAAECLQLIQDLCLALGGDLGDMRHQLPVAFYGHLRSTLLDEDLWQNVEQYGVGKTSDDILRGIEPDFSIGINYRRVLEKGIELAQSNQLFNHLTRMTVA